MIKYIYITFYFTQKRGLPHVHLLLIVENAHDKPRTAEYVDKVVSCEVPDKNIDPVLHKLVGQHMVHGPCGDLNPQCPCMHSNPKSRGKCCKGFPFPYCEETQVETNGYPQYKRPEGGPKFTAIKRNDKFYNDIDSRWIVPYNPYLLRKYKCHFNVQTACSIKSVKYIYKYIYSKYFICYTCICILSKKL